MRANYTTARKTKKIVPKSQTHTNFAQGGNRSAQRCDSIIIIIVIIIIEGPKMILENSLRDYTPLKQTHKHTKWL